MTDILCESLLEMHFHHAIVDYFRGKYGARFLKLIKPSTNREAWVGFDQGWVKTTMTQDEVLRELQDAIHNHNPSPAGFYLGYFLQFKRVEQMMRRSIYTPPGWLYPCLRSELSLEINPQTGLSQHQTLIALSGVNNASVAYACPMIFDLDEIYDLPNLDLLRMVDVASSPKTFKADERHFIAFKSITDVSPVWLSKPIPAKSMGFKEWATEPTGPSKMSGEDVVLLIENASDAIKKTALQYDEFNLPEPDLYVPESFTLVEFLSG